MKKRRVLKLLLVFFISSCQSDTNRLVNDFRKASNFKRTATNSYDLHLSICDSSNRSMIQFAEDAFSQEFRYIAIIDSKSGGEFDTTEKMKLRTLLKKSGLLGTEYFSKTARGFGILVFDWKGDYNKIEILTEKILKEYYNETELKHCQIQIMEYKDSLTLISY